jgi:hypothetical protein
MDRNLEEGDMVVCVPPSRWAGIKGVIIEKLDFPAYLVRMDHPLNEDTPPISRQSDPRVRLWDENMIRLVARPETCSRCEQHPKMLDDYICEFCRYGS